MLQEIGKAKYRNVDEAKHFYEQEKLKNLTSVIFKDEFFHPKFKDYLVKLMRFQNPLALKVITQDLIEQGTGKRFDSTWNNFCNQTRQFMYPEVITAVDILRKCTPEQIWSSFDIGSLREEKLIEEGYEITYLEYFNLIAYPEIKEIVKYTEDALLAIEKKVMDPIKAEINANLKMQAKIPLTAKNFL